MLQTIAPLRTQQPPRLRIEELKAAHELAESI
jgi:hypothetical protein